MNRRTTTLIGLLLVLLGGIGIWTVISNANVSTGRIQVNEDKQFDAASIQHLELQTDIADVTIVSSPDDRIRVKLAGNLAKKHWKELDFAADTSGETLNVKAQFRKKVVLALEPGFWLPFFTGGPSMDLRLEVALPNRSYGSVRIKTNTGDLQLEPLAARNMTIQTDTGDVVLNGFEGELLDIASNTGEIELSQVAAGMVVRSDVGDLQISLKELVDDVKVTTAVGEVDMFVDRTSGLAFSLRSEVGDIDVSAPEGTIRYDVDKTRHRSGHIAQDGPTIDIRTDVGDISLTVREVQ